ncbi:glutathione S-transferase 1-1-like [Schistocerca cancellata]|uniref:glutathione S-transferase 1-1-like n=1 Tax=Schistocerca cancellata TaxID=274614 RepID=UPI002118284C|nr:glutathione S-transferase 1-1-like [Schistocerca cancellata]
MASVDFYYWPASAPCMTVQMVAQDIGVKLNMKFTNPQAGDHMKPEFLKMNPQHTVPTLNDNGFCLSESHVIIAYLVDQYAKDDSLYPKDAKKRALVNQRLFFNVSTLYRCFSAYYYPVMIRGAKQFDPVKLKELETAYEFLNTFLEGQQWVAGTSMTIADYAILTSVSTADAVGFNIKKYPNVDAWFKRVKTAVKSYEENYRQHVMVFKKKYDDVTGKK